MIVHRNWWQLLQVALGTVATTVKTNLNRFFLNFCVAIRQVLLEQCLKIAYMLEAGMEYAEIYHIYIK